MLQLTGCFMIIAGCVGIAAVVCRDYNSRLFLLKQIREIYENLKYYITYQKMTIPEAVLRLSEKERGPFPLYYMKFMRKTEKETEIFPIFGTGIWEKCYQDLPCMMRKRSCF